MTTKILTGVYSYGYDVHAPTRTVEVAAGAYIGGGYGVHGISTLATDTGAYAIVNAGTIVGSVFGLLSGVYLSHGGSVTNGSDTATSAVIKGQGGVQILGASGTVANFGLVDGTSYANGVSLGAGGRVTNGDTLDTSAVIHGYRAVLIGAAAGTVVNDGSIIGYRQGVVLDDGGSVINGANQDTGALIQSGYVGYYGLSGPFISYGIAVEGAAGTVRNFGTVQGQSGVALYDGGSLTNGSSGDTTALIRGGGPKGNVVAIQGAPGAVTNFGTLLGGSVALYDGGVFTNGAGADTGALLAAGSSATGFYGATLATTVINFGTIAGDGGVILAGGGVVANGSVTDHAALIYAVPYGIAVYLPGPGTVTNFATISASGGYAVKFNTSGDVLVAEAGSSFIGAVAGGGGTLELGRGTGVISGLGGAGAVTGATAMTFSGFGAYAIDVGGAWTLSGANTLRSGVTLTNDAALFLNGSLSVDGAIDGAGRLRLVAKSDRLTLGAGAAISGTVEGGDATLDLAAASGTITNLGAAATLSGGDAMTFSGFGAYVLVAGGAWTLAGTSTLGVGRSLTDFGAIDGGLTLGAASARLILGDGATISGAVAGGAGTLELASGTDTLTGLGAAATLAGSAAMSFSGFGVYRIDAGVALTLNGTNSLGAASRMIDDGSLTVAAGASLSRLGALTFGDDATLTNAGSITGSIGLNGADDRLIADTGSLITGQVTGGGGTLELGSATGAITGLGAGGVVSGGMALSFKGFDAYQLDAGGAWTLADTTVLKAGQTLTVFGHVDDGLTLGSAGATLAVGSGAAISGAVAGNGGTLELVSGRATARNIGGAGTLTGQVSMTFSGFGSYLVGAEGALTLAGANSGTLSVAGTLTNLGALTSAAGVAATLTAGAAIINGSATATDALIYGQTGLYAGTSGPVNITNFGAIEGHDNGIVLHAGGTILNGSLTDQTAAIVGNQNAAYPDLPGDAIKIYGAAGTVTNFGSILASKLYRATALYLGDGGEVTNGADTDTTALIDGYNDGLFATNAAATVTNFGSIEAYDTGALLLDGGTLTNGDAGDHDALISGIEGVLSASGSTLTVTNYGTIIGTSHEAVVLGASSDVLIAEAGSKIVGVASGGGGTLVLASGDGTVTGLGLEGVVTGQESLTISNFGAYVMEAGTSFTLAGTSILTKGKSLTVEGAATNTGVIDAVGNGVDMTAGATLSNAGETALISGSDGVYADGPAVVRNSGAIIALGSTTGYAAVQLYGGGSVSNGSNQDTTALIQASSGALGVELGGPGKVANFGSISAEYGVVLIGGGSLSNGSATDTSALIHGAIYGIYAGGAAATVTNMGTISGYSGISMFDGGTVINGSNTDTHAQIDASLGVFNFHAHPVGISGGAGTVINFGTMVGGLGVIMAYGVAINGSASDTTAFATEFYFDGQGASTVTNFGTVDGIGSSNGYQTVVNGSASDTTALVNSSNIAVVAFMGGHDTVTNFGTMISRLPDGDGGILANDSTITNGSLGDTAALITGCDGIGGSGFGLSGSTIMNFGTVIGFGDPATAYGQVAGAYVSQLSYLTNGSLGDTVALIRGYQGVVAGAGVDTVTNFGTIEGVGGAAVKFETSGDTLAVEAGSRFIGAVLGDGSTLVLASGVGSVSLAQASGGLNETVTGSMARTVFTDFDTVEVAAGAAFTVTDGAAIETGQSVIAAGGVLTFAKAITGTGVIEAGAGGTVKVQSTAAATLSMSFTGGDATLALASPAKFAATVSGFAATDVIDLLGVTATSVTLGASDLLTIMNGGQTIASLQLSGTYTGDTFTLTSDHAGGTDITVNATAPSPAAAPIVPHAPAATPVAPAGTPDQAWAALQAGGLVQATAAMGVANPAAATLGQGADAWRPQTPAFMALNRA